MLMTSPFMCPIVSNGGKSLSVSANNTQNMIYYHLKDVYGVPCVIDDIMTNGNLPVSDLIYGIVQGEDKGRMNGSGEAREVNSWSGVVITSSESPIMDAVKGDQGLKARVLHTYGIQWTMSAEQSTLIKRVLSQNYGFTGKEFADYVATIPLDDLYSRFLLSLDVVKTLMVKKDRLTDRLAHKYAAVHLTVLLVNEALQFNMSANDIASLFIKCEQDCFEERDNSIKAYKAVLDYIDRHESHFYVETHYTKAYNGESQIKPADCYGTILKYDTYWEVHLLEEITKEILEKNGLGGELRGIRQKWIERELAKGDGDHNTRKYSIEGQVARCDCLIIQGGIVEPQGEEPPKAEEVAQPETPVSTYEVDDSKALDDLFGGEE